MEKNPLVSVVVITYNSSEYVIETLESIKRQTYKNIEIIITDDCSTDNTVELCHNWIHLNKNDFVNVCLILSEHNTGISPNCNRGFRKVSGTWVKSIAGDDILLDNCIEDNVNYVISHPESKAVFSGMKSFYAIKGQKKIIESLSVPFEFVNASCEKQLKDLLITNVVFAPTAFVNYQTLKEVDFCDENYPYMEDYPLWIKFLTHKVRLNYFDRVTVMYRRGLSLTYTPDKIVNVNYIDSYMRFHKDILFRLYPKNMFFYKVHMLICFYRIKIGILYCNNRPSKKYRLIRRILKVFDIYNSYFLLKNFVVNKLP